MFVHICDADSKVTKIALNLSKKPDRSSLSMEYVNSDMLATVNGDVHSHSLQVEAKCHQQTLMDTVSFPCKDTEAGFDANENSLGNSTDKEVLESSDATDHCPMETQSGVKLKCITIKQPCEKEETETQCAYDLSVIESTQPKDTDLHQCKSTGDESLPEESDADKVTKPDPDCLMPEKEKPVPGDLQSDLEFPQYEQGENVLEPFTPWTFI